MNFEQWYSNNKEILSIMTFEAALQMAFERRDTADNVAGEGIHESRA